MSREGAKPPTITMSSRKSPQLRRYVQAGRADDSEILSRVTVYGSRFSTHSPSMTGTRCVSRRQPRSRVRDAPLGPSKPEPDGRSATPQLSAGAMEHAFIVGNDQPDIRPPSFFSEPQRAQQLWIWGPFQIYGGYSKSPRIASSATRRKDLSWRMVLGTRPAFGR